MKDKPLPDPIYVKIESLDHDLNGVAYFNERSYQFKYVLPGDEITFLPLGRGKRRWNKILDKSSDITNAKCKHFSICGGCRGQHIEYDKQFELKTKPIIDYYQNNWSLNLNKFPSEKIFHYRNRMDFAVFPGFVGLREEGNFRKIVDIERCEIQSEKANIELSKVKSIVLPLAYDRKLEIGFIKYVTLRYSNKYNELLTIITVIENFEDSKEEEKFIEDIFHTSTAENIIICYNRKKSEVSAIGKKKIIKGKDYITEEVFGKELDIPFDAFFQTNPKGFSSILNFIKSILEENNFDKLVDLFCGSGFFSLLFAENFSSIHGWDISDSSITKAKEQKEKLYPENKILFEVKDLYTIKKDFIDQDIFNENTLLIMDPPRNGIGNELANSLIDSEVKYICYVSCNPYSQIKDIENLQNSYKPINGLITDPYPHTPHLESVLFLERNK